MTYATMCSSSTAVPAELETAVTLKHEYSNYRSPDVFVGGTQFTRRWNLIFCTIDNISQIQD
jgi:hypothetical protein